MFDQSYGLRFDIYERINLTEDLPGIDELEEAELIPHIQVISQQDQATLRGHLLLAGLYKGDTEAGETEPLEHWIPVEFTVPLHRVSSLDDIAVEIENFDVDLLSKRSLNITGGLARNGIQAAAPGARDQVWANEEVTVVHAPE
ncbi:peptidoglycan-binding protein, partial [Clostridium perfringens]